MIAGFDYQPRTRVLFGPGCLQRLSEVAATLGFRRTLLVSDPGILEAGHPAKARTLLEQAGIAVELFHEFSANPDAAMVEAGRQVAAAFQADSLIGLGGGSSMDCAKGINFVLTNGGEMPDYWGYGRATQPLLPSLGVPTTAGTGSEGQSYALISHSKTHAKMACGDPGAAFRVALLDPELAVTQPFSVRAMAGYDAVSHAVETFVSTKRNAMSDCFSREAWRLLAGNYRRTLAEPGDVEAVGAMQLGAHLAGLAIENSMLGAAHACANPLTQNFGVPHGAAIAVVLPHVVRWNSSAVGNRYSELADSLPSLLREMAAAAKLDKALCEWGVPESELPALASEAAVQWTGRFNPRHLDTAGALEIYRCAYQ